MKIQNSLVAFALLSSGLFAGGDVAPIIEKPVVVMENNSAYYIGLGYGYFNQSVDNNQFSDLDFELDSNSVMLQAGYQYNKYLAVEGRYWIGVGDITIDAAGLSEDESGDYNSWGLYVKPMYPVTESFDIYALLGYASNSVSFDDGAYWDTDGFSWGLGTQYEILENVVLFADYVNMGMKDDFDLTYGNNIIPDLSADIDLYTVNVGISYKF